MTTQIENPNSKENQNENLNTNKKNKLAELFAKNREIREKEKEERKRKAAENYAQVQPDSYKWFEFIDPVEDHYDQIPQDDNYNPGQTILKASYLVREIDENTGEKSKAKRFTQLRVTTAEELDDLLEEGFREIKIKRTGKDKNTRYKFTPKK